MLYTGFEEIENYIDADIVNKYDIWFAHWARSCGYKGENLSIWQYGGETNLIESNSIAGVGVIDKNLCYKDYPTIIKNGGYNGWSAAEKPPTAGVTAKQAMDAACSLIGKDEKPNECDIMAWYGGFDTDIYSVACCCAGMMYLFFNVLNAGYLIPGGKVADCGSLALNFYNAGQLHKPADVRPGDLVIFSWSHEKTSVSPLDSLGFMCFEHVELCLEVRDDTILSIGANNGGIECDDFQIKTRSRADISACCRPKYADSGSDPVASEPVAVGNEAVKEVQQWLNSRYHVNIEEDGIYGTQTRKALTKALQTELNEQFGAGLAVDGIYGPQTKAAVRNISGGVFSNYIKVLQGFLICNGYDTGGLDGVFGNETDRAVRQYQRDNSLTVDGIAGRKTFAELCT